MQQSIDVVMFKGKLRGYNFFKKQIKKYNDEIEYCYDMLGASPKSPNLTSEPIHSVKNIDKEYETRQKISELESKLKQCESEIKFCDTVLAGIDETIRKAIVNIYINRCTVQSEARRLYMAKSTLQDNINKAMETSIDSMFRP